MNKHLLIQVLATLVVVGLVTTALLTIMDRDVAGQEPAAANAPGGGTADVPPVAVQVISPQRENVTRMLRLPATLLADEEVELFADTSGYISTVHVDIGDRVRCDDVLIELEVPEMFDELRHAEAVLEARKANVLAAQAKAVQAELMVASARAHVERTVVEHQLSKLKLHRQTELHEANAIPESVLDESKSAFAFAEAQIKIARAEVARAVGAQQAAEADVFVARSQVAVAEADVARLRTLMGYAKLTAPFDGIITERHVDHGDFVRSAAEGTTMTLLAVAKTDRMRLRLDIPESDAPFVRLGTEIEFVVRCLGDEPIQATITRTAFALRTSTRTMRAEADLDNRDGRLQPGMYAQVAVKLETREQALVIPSKAIRVRGKNMSVLVADAGVAKALPVKVGYDDGIQIEVLEGLRGHEQVIVAASSAVAPGGPVKAVPTN